MADCTVKITVKMGHAKVTKYECKTQQGRLPLYSTLFPDRTLLDNLAKTLDLEFFCNFRKSCFEFAILIFNSSQHVPLS